MSKKLLALLLAMIMVIGSFTSVLADTKTDAEKPAAEKEKVEEKKDEAKPEEKKDEAKPEEKTEEKKEEKKEEPAKDEALDRAMEVLKKAKVIEGFKAGEEDFKAEQNITRAQFAAMIVRANNLAKAAEAAKVTPTGFTDVPVTHWANGYIAIAKNQMYVNGYPSGKFMPEGQITYQEMAKMLVCALGKGEVGDIWPTSYIVKAQSLGLLNGVTAPVFTEKATRGDVFKMLYNMMNSKEFGNRKILKAIVLENSRVENLADDEVTVEVIDVVQKADWVEKSRSNDKKGDQHTYKLDKDLMLDAEDLLGKVVDITVDQNDKIVEVKVDKTYDYVEGSIDGVGPRKFVLDDNTYSAAFDERYYSRDERIFRTYLNNEDYTYADFAKKFKENKYDFARATVKNGKVIFIDAYNFNDIAPVVEVKDGAVYYRDDAWAANVVKASKLNDRVVFHDAKGFSVAERKAIAKDDVIHFYNDYKDAIVRKDAKVEAKLDKTLLKRDGSEWIVLGKDEYILNSDEPLQAIYSYEGKKYLVLKDGDRSLVDGMRGENVKVLVALDGSAQLIEGTKAWNDGINAITRITSRGEVKFLPSTGEEFWAEETRNTRYVVDKKSNNSRLLDFGENDIVYLARGEKEEISYMGRLIKAGEYPLHPYAKMNGRFIMLDTNKTTQRTYRYFSNLHAFALDKDGNLHQVGDLNKFIADNSDNKDLKAYVMSEKDLKEKLEDKNTFDLNTYKFLSDDENLASVVIFKDAVITFDADYDYVEVIKTWNNKTAIDVMDSHNNVFTLELVNDVDAKYNFGNGDIVKIKVNKDSKDVKKGCVVGVEIPVGAKKYSIEEGKYPQTYKIGEDTYKWDAKQVVFYPNASKTVQFTKDKYGFIKVMRFVRDGGTVYTNILDQAAVTASGNYVIVLKNSKGEFVANYYVNDDTRFEDETGRPLGFGHWAVASFNAMYGEGTVKVITDGRYASLVKGLKKKAAFDEEMLKAELNEKVRDTVEAIGEVEFDSSKNSDQLKLTAFGAKVEEALKKVFKSTEVGSATFTAATASDPAKVTVKVTTAGKTITLVSTIGAKEITTKITGTIPAVPAMPGTPGAPAVTASTEAKNAYKALTTAKEDEAAEKAVELMEYALNNASDPIVVGKDPNPTTGYALADVEAFIIAAMSKADVKNFDISKVTLVAAADSTHPVASLTHVADDKYTLVFYYTLSSSLKQSNTVNIRLVK